MPWLHSIAKPTLRALAITAPSSLGQIKDSGPVDAEALTEPETVEDELVAVAVEFWYREIEPEAVLAVLEELVELERDSTRAKVIPGASRLVDWLT
jgi:hypothetical protein